MERFDKQKPHFLENLKWLVKKPGNSSREGQHRMKTLARSEIDSARLPSVWDLGNKILYDMCRNYPGHDTNEKIIAKIWLIGRSYAASIERRKNAAQIGDSFYTEVVVPEIQNSPIDSWLREVPKEEPGNSQTVSVHKKLQDTLFSITGLHKRSLSSKYLHFHCPGSFFLYDSRARRSVMKLTPHISSIPTISADEFDTEYRDFVRRCLWLWNNIRENFGFELTPREMDNLLLNAFSEDMESQYGQ